MPSLGLEVALGLLMVDSIIELSFISSMVAWLHARAGKAFEVEYNGSSFSLHGKPEYLLVNQGHTSNGAAGTAFVAIGMGGILALFLRSRSQGRFSRGLYGFWLVMTVLSALLSIAALIFTFLITHDHTGQTIDVQLASALNNQPYPNYVAYPIDQWTPENWFDAVLKLDLIGTGDRADIHLHLLIMRAWRWNLIPMAVLGIAVCALAILDNFRERRNRQVQETKHASAFYQS